MENHFVQAPVLKASLSRGNSLPPQKKKKLCSLCKVQAAQSDEIRTGESIQLPRNDCVNLNTFS